MNLRESMAVVNVWIWYLYWVGNIYAIISVLWKFSWSHGIGMAVADPAAG